MQHQIESIVSPVAQVLERSAAASPAPAVFTTPSSSHDPVFSFGASSSISLEAQDQRTKYFITTCSSSSKCRLTTPTPRSNVA
jgi:hypothetical protein